MGMTIWAEERELLGLSPGQAEAIEGRIAERQTYDIPSACEDEPPGCTRLAEAEAELGRLQLAHLRVCTELRTTRTQRDEARARLAAEAERRLRWRDEALASLRAALEGSC